MFTAPDGQPQVRSDPITDPDDIAAGARNLLQACAGLRRGQSVLILHEPAGTGYYGAGLADDIGREAARLGLVASLAEVPFRRDVQDPEPRLQAMMEKADCTVFVARIGDQIRFRPASRNARAVVSYALDGAMLGSSFGRAGHGGVMALKEAIDLAMGDAREITVTCPLGTQFSGRQGPLAPDADVTVRRFPLSVFAPAPAKGFSGRIAQRGFLVGTGSSYYSPYACRLNDILFIDFEGGRLAGFDGHADDVAAARSHYDHVSQTLGIEADFVHSWHAGIHPGCAFDAPASASFERWSGGAFGNPRLLHFHTCGAYAPGEISLNVLDPTIRLDGVAVWESGRLHPDRILHGADILRDHSDLSACFDAPAQACGLGPCDALSFD